MPYNTHSFPKHSPFIRNDDFTLDMYWLPLCYKLHISGLVHKSDLVLLTRYLDSRAFWTHFRVCHIVLRTICDLITHFTILITFKFHGLNALKSLSELVLRVDDARTLQINRTYYRFLWLIRIISMIARRFNTHRSSLAHRVRNGSFDTLYLDNVLITFLLMVVLTRSLSLHTQGYGLFLAAD